MSLSDLKLIAAVEQRRWIYDKLDPRYSNRELTSMLWLQCAKEINIDAAVAKKRWAYLRDYFVKQYKYMIMSKSGRESLNKKRPWPLFERMKFLVPFLALPVVPTRAESPDPENQTSGEFDEKPHGNVPANSSHLAQCNMDAMRCYFQQMNMAAINHRAALQQNEQAASVYNQMCNMNMSSVNPFGPAQGMLIQQQMVNNAFRFHPYSSSGMMAKNRPQPMFNPNIRPPLRNGFKSRPDHCMPIRPRPMPFPRQPNRLAPRGEFPPGLRHTGLNGGMHRPANLGCSITNDDTPTHQMPTTSMQNKSELDSLNDRSDAQEPLTSASARMTHTNNTSFHDELPTASQHKLESGGMHRATNFGKCLTTGSTAQAHHQMLSTARSNVYGMASSDVYNNVKEPTTSSGAAMASKVCVETKSETLETEQLTDSHEHFLKSLLPSVRKLDALSAMKFRVETEELLLVHLRNATENNLNEDDTLGALQQYQDEPNPENPSIES